MLLLAYFLVIKSVLGIKGCFINNADTEAVNPLDWPESVDFFNHAPKKWNPRHTA